MEARPAAPVRVQERSTGGRVKWSGGMPRASMSRNVQSACAGRPERASDARRELKEASVVAGPGGIRRPGAVSDCLLGAAGNAPGTAVSPAARQGGELRRLGAYAYAYAFSDEKWTYLRIASCDWAESVAGLAA